MERRIMLLLSLLLFFLPAKSQQQNQDFDSPALQLLKDSLNMPAVMNSVVHQAKILFNIGFMYDQQAIYNRAINYYEQAITLPNIKPSSNPILWYNLTNSYGMDLCDIGLFAKAEKILQQAVSVNEDYNLNYLGVYANLFDLYSRKNEFKKAKLSATKYLKIATKLQDPSKIAFSYYLLGRANNIKQGAIQAKIYLLKSIKLYRKTKDSTQICDVLYQLGTASLYLDELKKANDYFDQIIANKSSYCNYIIPFAQMDLALIKSKQKSFGEALSLLEKALTFLNQSGDQQGKIQCFTNLAIVQREFKHYPLALQYVLKAKQLALSIGDQSNVGKLNELLPNLFAETGQYRKAFEAAQDNRGTADSLNFNLEIINRKLALQLQKGEYENRLKEQTLKTKYSQATANRNLIGMILVGAVGIILFLFYRNRSLRAEKTTLVLREESRKKNEELRAFNYTVGHDLKSPVENIQMVLQNFKTEFSAVLPQESLLPLDKIDALSQEARLMIEGMLEYAEKDQSPFQLGVFETARVVSYILKTIQDANPDSFIWFKIHDLPDQAGDPFLLRHVFVNLIQNAVKFTVSSKPPLVEIYSITQETSRIFYVKDNGVGFPHGAENQIFELFKTAHNRADYAGTGIGLAIVKRIIERHGGKVWAEHNPTGGAIFGFSLPLISPATNS